MPSIVISKKFKHASYVNVSNFQWAEETKTTQLFNIRPYKREKLISAI